MTADGRDRALLRARRLLEAYIGHLTAERRFSNHTVRAYGRDVAALIELAGATPLERLHAHEIRRFVAQLHGRGLTGKSLARTLSAWRGFFRYLARDHGSKHNPCAGVRAPKAAKKLPRALSPDEAQRLLERDAADALARRDKAMLELPYSSGLRLSELIGLQVNDVSFEDRTVRLTGKGAKTRIVPVGGPALAALRAWLESRAALAAPETTTLFLNYRGKPLSARAVQQRLERWALAQGLGRRVHPHVLRHSFASHVLQSSGDLRAVQEMLGHASISTTQMYTQLDFQHLAKVYDAAHPRARKRG
jgi:integrase/recombinase XerC